MKLINHLLILIASLSMVILFNCPAGPDVNTKKNIPTRISVNKPLSVNKTRLGQSANIQKSIVKGNLVQYAVTSCDATSTYFSNFQSAMFKIEDNQIDVEFVLDIGNNMTDTQITQAKAGGIVISHPGDPMATSELIKNAFDATFDWNVDMPMAGWDTIYMYFPDYYDPGNSNDATFTLVFDRVAFSNGNTIGTALYETPKYDFLPSILARPTKKLYRFNLNSNFEGSSSVLDIQSWLSDTTGINEDFRSYNLIALQTDKTVSSTGVKFSYIQRWVTQSTEEDDIFAYKMTGYVDDIGGTLIASYQQRREDFVVPGKSLSVDHFIDRFDSMGCLLDLGSDKSEYFQSTFENGVWKTFVSSFPLPTGGYSAFAEDQDVYNMAGSFNVADLKDIYEFSNDVSQIEVTIPFPATPTGGMAHIFMLQGSGVSTALPTDQTSLTDAHFFAGFSAFDNVKVWLDATENSKKVTLIAEQNVNTMIFGYYQYSDDFNRDPADPVYADSTYANGIFLPAATEVRTINF